MGIFTRIKNGFCFQNNLVCRAFRSYFNNYGPQVHIYIKFSLRAAPSARRAPRACLYLTPCNSTKKIFLFFFFSPLFLLFSLFLPFFLFFLFFSFSLRFLTLSCQFFSSFFPNIVQIIWPESHVTNCELSEQNFLELSCQF